jgi:hypothetical protein
MALSGVDLARRLHGPRCECGGSKNAGHSFCFLCYGALPLGMQRALWRRIGCGYGEAFLAALGWLQSAEAGGWSDQGASRGRILCAIEERLKTAGLSASDAVEVRERLRASKTAVLREIFEWREELPHL